MLTMHYLLYLWRYRIRRQNPVLSVFWPVPDDLLTITRPQRIACMCLELMVRSGRSLNAYECTFRTLSLESCAKGVPRSQVPCK